jgi:hypothetical protein
VRHALACVRRQQNTGSFVAGRLLSDDGRTHAFNGKQARAPTERGDRFRPISSVPLPRSARSLFPFRRHAAGDRLGDDAIALATMRSPGAGSIAGATRDRFRASACRLLRLVRPLRLGSERQPRRLLTIAFVISAAYGGRPESTESTRRRHRRPTSPSAQEHARAASEVGFSNATLAGDGYRCTPSAVSTVA